MFCFVIFVKQEFMIACEGLQRNYTKLNSVCSFFFYFFPQATDDQMNTPLHLAAQDGHRTIVRLLLSFAKANLSGDELQDVSLRGMVFDPMFAF